jgi:UDP-galactopyranose mutase
LQKTFRRSFLTFETFNSSSPSQHQKKLPKELLGAFAMKVLVVGAGFTGAVIARELAEADHSVLVIDERTAVAGNCHTEVDGETGVMVHTYGPHIFHTDDEKTWNYICRFGKMMPFRNQVKARVGGQVFSMPINLHTINQFFDTAMAPQEAEKFIRNQADNSITSPESFEEQALKFVGERLYKAFFYGYTKKQWGVEPSLLPASILKRLPLRFSYNDNYFNHKYQGIPKDGYTAIVLEILRKNNIEVKLNCAAETVQEQFDHVIYTGPLDRFYKRRFGQLTYRTLEFEREVCDGDFQGTAVMNYCDEGVPFTRISEHQHFAPWNATKSGKSVYFKEFSRNCGPDDIPFYPVRRLDDKSKLKKYVKLANSETNVTFAGRLGTYAYLDMNVSIERALETAEALKNAWAKAERAPVFVHNPI